MRRERKKEKAINMQNNYENGEEEVLARVRELLVEQYGEDLLEQVAQEKLRTCLTDYDGAVTMALPEVLLTVLQTKNEQEEEYDDYDEEEVE